MEYVPGAHPGRDIDPDPTRVATCALAIIQSCYNPLERLFDLIGQSDEYVVFDSAQFTKRHWHTATDQDRQVADLAHDSRCTKGPLRPPIDEVEIEKPWAKSTGVRSSSAYRPAPFFDQFAPTLCRGAWFMERADAETRLTGSTSCSCGNRGTARITTRMSGTAAYPADGTKTTRLLNSPGPQAPTAISRPSARAISRGRAARPPGIATEWDESYQGYKGGIRSCHGDFEQHAVSVLDLRVQHRPGRRALSLADTL